MTVFLLLYLCADATRTDCQVVKVNSWNSPNAYEECTEVVPQLTEALTPSNRKRHRFVCEIKSGTARPAGHELQPTFTHQSIRM